MTARQRIECRHRLIEQQQAWLLRQGDGERDLCPLPPGHRAHGLIELDAERSKAGSGRVRVPAQIEVRADFDVVLGAEPLVHRNVLREEPDIGEEGGILRRGPAEYEGLAAARGAQTRQDLEEGRLACAVGADERRDATGRHADRAVGQRRRRAILFGQPSRLDRHFHGHATLSPRSSRDCNVDRMSASIAWSSRPTARALATQRPRLRANVRWALGGGPGGAESRRCRPQAGPPPPRCVRVRDTPSARCSG